MRTGRNVSAFICIGLQCLACLLQGRQRESGISTLHTKHWEKVTSEWAMAYWDLTDPLTRLGWLRGSVDKKHTSDAADAAELVPLAGRPGAGVGRDSSCSPRKAGPALSQAVVRWTSWALDCVMWLPLLQAEAGTAESPESTTL